MIDDVKAAANRKARDALKNAHLHGMFDHYTAQYRALANQDAPSAARSVHRAIDLVLARDRNKSATSGDIQCRKGCDRCCRGPVEVWPQEAALLAGTALKSGIAIDTTLLERQSRYTMDTWREQPATDRACVFLGNDGVCKVYEFRPSACRKLLVVTDPALCDADIHTADRVGRWFSWEAEILESAALQVFGAALMPNALLEALRGREREGTGAI